MKKLFLFLAATMVSVASMATYTLNNPIGADGRYIVKYDMANHQFAAANDMEVDETFVLAVDVTGTWLEEWLKATPIAADASRGVAFNCWTSCGDTHSDFRRLMQIEGNIWGYTCNFAQAKDAAADWSIAMMTDSVLYVYGQFFGFEYTAENSGAGWWMGANGGFDGEQTMAEGSNCVFAFAPYTGAYTSNPLFVDDFKDFDVKGDIYGIDITGYCAPGVDLEWNFEEHGDLYIIGNLAGNDWKPETAQKMDYVGQGCFATVCTFVGSPAYFAFTRVQSADWAAVNDARFAGDANDLLTDKTPTECLGFGDNKCFTVAGGTYKVVYNVATNKCTVIEEVAAGFENLETVKAVKFIENGQVYILKNGVRYNVLGAQVK